MKIILFTLFSLAIADIYSINCYDQSATYSGVNNNTRMGDFPTLNQTINNGTLSSDFRIAAIKSCLNNQTNNTTIGKLLGHQIALANYS